MADKVPLGGATRRTLAIFFATITLIILGGGYFFCRSETESVRKEKYTDIATIAAMKARQIVQWRQGRLSDVWRAANGPRVISLLPEFIKLPDAAGVRTELKKLLEVNRKGDVYANAFLIAPNGKILLAAQDDPNVADPVTQQTIVTALARRESVLSDFFRHADGIVYIDAAAVVRDAEGRPLAIFFLRSNAESQLYPLVQSWPTPSRSAETLLVQRQGEEVLLLNELRHRAKTALSMRESLTLTTLPVVQAVLGQRGMFQGRDYRGEEVLADLRPVPGLPWFMVTKVDTREVLSEARYHVGLIVGMVILLILLAAAVTAFAYRQQQAGFFRGLYQSERQKLEAQEEYRITLYSIGDAVIATDSGGGVREMNPVAETLTGWNRAEAQGKPLADIFHIVNEETRAMTESPVQRVLREGAVVGLANHTILIARDGTERPIADSAAPIRVESGADITGVVLVFHDQTAERASLRQLQRMGEEARANEKRFRALIEHSHDAIVLLAADGTVLYDSPSFSRLMGYTPAERLGRNTFEFAHPDERQSLVQGFAAFVQQKGAVASHEARFLHKDGTPRLFEVVRTNLLHDPDVRAVVVNFHDITESRLLEEQHRQAMKMEAVGRLAGGVAHDFNNMLMVIHGNAKLCLERIEAGHPMREWLDEISKGAERATTITSQLLAFARRQPIAPKVLDLNVTIADMLKLLQRLIGENITINWRPGADLWPVAVDPAQVDQILTNLMINARDSINGSGSITISTANAIIDQFHRFRYQDAAPGNYVLLRVADTGCGMDQKTMSHVFEPFFTTKLGGKGTGLGLATVYGIVKQNHGFVDIHSEPGQGTQFKIYWPCALAQNVPAAAEKTPSAAIGGSETILLVEDEELVCAILQRFLANLGYTLLVAESPEKALRLAAEHSGEIHLLLTDVVMPGMNGKELAQRLSELRPSIKRLFISGFPANVLSQQGILAANMHFLHKPFLREELAHKVREVLDLCPDGMPAGSGYRAPGNTVSANASTGLEIGRKHT